MEKIALEDINVENPYLRTKTDIESLKKSLETIGLINPLTINKKNELLAGGRRYQALKELGITTVAVNRVDLSGLEQELISIDENLVRSPLNKLELEQCLNRGREIYEQLNPSALKISTEVKVLTSAEKKEEKEQEENDTTSFAAITSEKTGLSKSVIKNAIKRDAASSNLIKQARGSGDLSASQVNEIIKLNMKEQDMILPYIQEKSVRDVRRIVDNARERGVDEAIRNSMEEKELPREFKGLESFVKKTNKQLSKIIIENIDVEHPELNKILEQVELLARQSEEFIELYQGDRVFTKEENQEPLATESLQ